MKWTTYFNEMELDTEYTFYAAERGERDSLGVPMEPDHEEYIEVESINGAEPREFCNRHDICLEDLENQLLEEHYSEIDFDL